MSDILPTELRRALTEQLAGSLTGPIPEGTPRRVFGATGVAGKATSVVGMRRAGKTTYLHQLRRERWEAGAPRESLVYVNFEDERLVELRGEQLGFLVNEYRRRFPEVADRHTTPLWCFDEIQVVPGWERFVRRMLDAGDCDVIVTGSSAALLSREIATALRGRGWEVPIYPFSFGEALRHRGEAIPARPGFLSAKERARIERMFAEWLVVGGFPEAQSLGAGARHQLLRDYVDVAILRDVVERHEVSQVTGLRWLVRHLLGNAAARFSVQKFYAALRSQGLAIAKDTVHQLLAHLEDCFLVRVVWMESGSERQRMANPRKSYPVDPGLIPIFDRIGRPNTGHSLETAVLIELQRRRHELTYVRTPSGYEVDFLARDAQGNEELIQVCSDASDPETASRELRALQEAAEQHPRAQQRLLTLSGDGAPAQAPAEVIVQPAYEWMLTEPESG